MAEQFESGQRRNLLELGQAQSCDVGQIAMLEDAPERRLSIRYTQQQDAAGRQPFGYVPQQRDAVVLRDVLEHVEGGNQVKAMFGC